MKRRDFLKLTSLVSTSALVPQLFSTPRWQSGVQEQNILVLVFDAWSARNVSLYGYPRSTMPNLERLAQRAVVYHNYYAGGPFTTPGTASLLTGLYPWTHRAFNVNGLVTKAHKKHSLWAGFPQYYKVGYSQNNYTVSLLRQLGHAGLDELIPLSEMVLNPDLLVAGLFSNDLDIAGISREMIFTTSDFSNSLLFPWLRKAMLEKEESQIPQDLREEFPRGFCSTHGEIKLILEDGVDWLGQQVPQFPQPFLGYFHFMPPHDPYGTRKEFINIFKGDDYLPPHKPENVFSRGYSDEYLNKDRRLYDEFIAYVDAEIYRLFGLLESAGVLENTWLLITSDHGEMFERGIIRHSTESLAQPVLNVPLLLFPPGGQERQDIYSPTSAVDVLPTLLYLTGQDIPDWCEGSVLPPFGSSAGVEDRPVFAQHLRYNKPGKPVDHGSYALIQGDYKLVYYQGWPQQQGVGEVVELYNLKDDPEELKDLSIRDKDRAAYMLEQIMAGIEQADDSFRR